VKIWQIVAVWLLCLVLVSSLSCNVLGGSADKQEEVSWEQVKVVPGDLTISVSGAGNIQVSKEENLTFERDTGRIEKILVNIGDKVNKGEVLAELAPLDSDALELALLKTKAALVQARVATDEAEYDLNQKKDVLHASYDQVKIAESKLEAAELQVETAELEVAQAQKKLENETITAPFNGVVASIGAEEGDTFHSTTGAGTKIISLIDTTALELGMQVDEIDIPKIKLNQKAVITLDALPGVQLDGDVNAIGPVPVETGGVVVYDVTIGLNVPEGYNLKVGMSATADIMVDTRHNVLLVPSRAIRQNEQGKLVLLVLVNGQVQPRHIVTGLSDGLQTEITEGVSEGETVVVEIQAETELSDGPLVPRGLFPGGQH